MGISLKGVLGGIAGFALGGPAGALTGYSLGAGMDASDAQEKAQQEANASIGNATAAQQQSQREAVAASLAGSQIGYDTYKVAQQQQMPWNLASLSALQTLPMLQQALGLPAYSVRQEIPNLPDVNFAQQFRDSLAGMSGQPSTPATERTPTGGSLNLGGYVPNSGLLAGTPEFTIGRNAAPGATLQGSTGVQPQPDLPNGIRVNQRAPDGTPATAAPATTAPATTAPSNTLTPYTGQAYSVEASPLYDFQKKEAVESLRNQLAAQGLGQSTYGQREESRIREGLAAQERERQVANMFQMLNYGFQSPTANAGNAANFGANAGSDVAQGLMNQGSIAATGGLASANLGMSAANANAQRPDPIMQAAQVYGMFNQGGGMNMFGGSNAANTGLNPTPYVPNYSQQMATMPGMGFAMPTF